MTDPSSSSPSTSAPISFSSRSSLSDDHHRKITLLQRPRSSDRDSEATTLPSSPLTRTPSPKPSSSVRSASPPVDADADADVEADAGASADADTTRLQASLSYFNIASRTDAPSSRQPSTASSESGAGVDSDESLLAALRSSKDRIFVLKMEMEMEVFVKDTSRSQIDLPMMNSYQRLLVHRCATRFNLGHEVDGVTKTMTLIRQPDSKIPDVRLGDLVEKPAEEAPPSAPMFKIMRRSAAERAERNSSRGSSVDGTGPKDRKHMTIEEREAAYQEARSRIFHGFEGKEKERDKAKEDKDKEKDKASITSTSSAASAASSASGSDPGGSSRRWSERRSNGGPWGPNSLRPSAPSFDPSLMPFQFDPAGPSSSPDFYRGLPPCPSPFLTPPFQQHHPHGPPSASASAYPNGAAVAVAAPPYPYPGLPYQTSPAHPSATYSQPSPGGGGGHWGQTGAAALAHPPAFQNQPTAAAPYGNAPFQHAPSYAAAAVPFGGGFPPLAGPPSNNGFPSNSMAVPYSSFGSGGGGGSGGMQRSPTASSASSTSTSSKSSRPPPPRFSPVPQPGLHSLPARPDWAIGLMPPPPSTSTTAEGAAATTTVRQPAASNSTTTGTTNANAIANATTPSSSSAPSPVRLEGGGTQEGGGAEGGGGGGGREDVSERKKMGAGIT